MTLRPSRKPLTQVLPDATVIPKLPVSPEIASRIQQLIFTALGVGREDEANDAVLAARQAAAWYVRAKLFEEQLPAFRRMISAGKGDLRDTVKGLLDKLPTTSDSVPFAQLRSLYCYGNPGANGNEEAPFKGLSEDERQNAYAQQFASKDEWDQRYGPEAVRPALEKWLALMEELKDWIPPTKAAKVAEHDFVAGLHAFWTEELRLKAENKRSDGSRCRPASPACEGHNRAPTPLLNTC